MNSPLQHALFYERIEQAMDAVIVACGGRKKIACEMWPDKPARDAHNLIDACLNPERREKFSPSQLLFLMKKGRDVGCHALAVFIAQDAGYEITPLVREEERDRLADALLEASRTYGRLIHLAEQVGAPIAGKR
jgi:hypothetical protein